MFAALLVVIAFHAARFPYFYIVLGLFPAAIGALVVGPMLERLEGRRQELVLLVVLWAPLGLNALLQAGVMLNDDLAPQRASLAFVEENFPRDARGFEGHAAFACRHDPEPFKTRFYQNVLGDFGGESGPAEAERMLAEFRVRPVQFMIEPLEHEPYPGALREFWATRYVLYWGHVRVPGRQIEGAPGWESELEVVVPGEYRWWSEGAAGRRLVVGADTLVPGGVVVLDGTGNVALSLPDGGEGIFALALDRPPAPDTTAFFRRF
jgi:hypothetical protein